MNIIYIDIDAIFWKAFNNLRLFNLTNFIKNINDEIKPDKILVFADFTTKEYLKPIAKTLIDMQDKFPIELTNGYSELETRNLTDLTLTNMLYQSIMNQETKDENTYTLVTASAKYLGAVAFLQNYTGKKFNLYIANDVPYLEHLNDYNVVGELDLDANKKNIADKITIKEIFKTVKWGEDNKHWLTVKNLIENCKTISKISTDKTEFMIHALISQDYLIKKMLKNPKENIEYKVVVMGEPEKTNKLLTTLE